MGVVIPQVVSEDRASGALVIDGGLRFDSGKTTYVEKTFGSAGNQKTWTWAGWVKRSKISSGFETIFGGGTGGAAESSVRFNGDDTIEFYAWTGSYNARLLTTQVFRDPSAWYHIVAVFDTPSATADQRIRLYINGTEITTFSSRTNPTQNYDGYINNSISHTIGDAVSGASPRFLNGYLSNIHFIDGQALGPEYFGYTDPLTNVWRPKNLKVQGNPNNGTVWSNYLTSSTGSFQDAATNAFDANGWSTNATPSVGGATLTFSPPTPIPVNSSLRVYATSDTRGSYETTLQVNGVTIPNIASSDGNPYVFDCGVPSSGVLSSISLARLSVRCAIYYIEVDGVMLVDSTTSNDYNYGQNGFHLPFDGSAPIGQDQSGRGNNWTPVNFGGSNTLEKATGALPILNTDGGGKVARVGVRTDAYADSLVLALPLVGIKSDFSNAVNSGTSNKAITSVNAVASSAQSNFYGGSWYFDGDGDYLSIPSSTDFGFGTGDFTIELWANGTGVFDSLNGGTFADIRSFAGAEALVLSLSTSGLINYYDGPANTSYNSTITLPTSKWTHIALTRASGVWRLFVDGALQKSHTNSSNLGSSQPCRIGEGIEGNGTDFKGYIQDFRIYKGVAKYTSNFIPASTDPDIVPDSPSGVSYSSNVALVPSTDGAVAFDGSGDYLSLVSSADFAFGTGDFTIEAFCYRQSGKFFTMFDHLMGAGNFTIFSYADDVIQVYNNAFLSSGVNPGNNKWFHLAVVRQSGVLSFYIDGIKASTTHSFTFNLTTAGVNIGVTQYTEYSTGFISNLHIVKGTALYTSNFTPPSAPLTSVANTKLLCCKSNTSATAFDISPGTITAVNALATNFNPFTVDIDTQRGKQSGYATWNPLNKSSQVTISNGNLNYSASGANTNNGVLGTIAVSSGKWYWEYTCTSSTSGTNFAYLGIAGVSALPSTLYGFNSTNYIYQATDGNKKNNDVSTAYGASWTTGDIIGVAFDADAGTLTFYKNNISQGVAFSSIPSNSYTPSVSSYASGTVSGLANFGQKPFKFPPPAGFQPLTLANTPRPTIVRPDQYVGVTTYTGSGAARSITIGFQPDFVWFKGRNNTTNHQFVDSVRGNSKYLSSDLTNQEATNTTALTAFTSTGFNLGDNSNTSQRVNYAVLGDTYVAWAWKAGGNSNTFNIDDVGYDTASAAGLTAGTITPTGASVNTKSGFSIIAYTGNQTGSTVSHGLGKVPAFIIIKNRDASTNWAVWHQSFVTAGALDYLYLNSTIAKGGDGSGAFWNSTPPTSSVFSLGSSATTNTNTNKMIAYCWAEIHGFSKFGSYIGDGSETGFGPFIQTGFRPRYVLIKSTTVAYSWLILDAVRNPYNLTTQVIYADTSGTEMTNNGTGTGGYESIDILSNGFQIKSNSSRYNQSGQTYIYAAWAEAPTFNLYGAQANAR